MHCCFLTNFAVNITILNTSDSNNCIIYTDGSCHTQLTIGAWVALVFVAGKQEILQGVAEETTHNRMELQAVISAVDYVNTLKKTFSEIEIYSDSQYVVNLVNRKDKLIQQRFLTKAGKPFPNVDLVKILIHQMENNTLIFNKVKAHQKQGEEINYNREADMRVRALLRGAIDKK